MATSTRTKKQTAVIGAVGAVLNSLVFLVALLADFPAEVTASIIAVVGSALALWRIGAGDVSRTDNRRGATRVEVVASLAVAAVSLMVFVFVLTLVGGCSQTVVANAPSRVDFDLNRRTCHLTVDVDGERRLTINPGKSTLCNVEVKP